VELLNETAHGGRSETRGRLLTCGTEMAPQADSFSNS
jgi:hypothetical protein